MMVRADSGLKPGRMRIALDGAGGEVNPVVPGVPPGGAAQAGRDFLTGGRQDSEWRVDPRPACRVSDREQVA
ncbi:hypothetical protein GCM10011534_14780 [Pseudooceanicola nanhaiensis]|jgi:hypothetical protein|uniref:Uncharacterized protein n=1 Tax=Pseudooceanicola nanhaiensis TaxID=375761 RepID=A0A917WD97_9RHOB|nr:hypothetical protein GCM10011534_14780 [Pseudooceanicola nanhaiensis]